MRFVVRLLGLLGLLGILPAPLQREWYRWALKEIDLHHPDLPVIVLRIRNLERGK